MDENHSDYVINKGLEIIANCCEIWIRKVSLFVNKSFVSMNRDELNNN